MTGTTMDADTLARFGLAALERSMRKFRNYRHIEEDMRSLAHEKIAGVIRSAESGSCNNAESYMVRSINNAIIDVINRHKRHTRRFGGYSGKIELDMFDSPTAPYQSPGPEVMAMFRELGIAVPEHDRPEVDPEELQVKTCEWCFHELPLSMFSPCKRRRAGVKNHCKPCHAAHARRGKHEVRDPQDPTPGEASRRKNISMSANH